MWNVPANASRGSVSGSRSAGSRRRSMFTLNCAPSAGVGAGSPSSSASACGEAFTSTCPASTTPSASAVRKDTSAHRPSVATDITSCPVAISAPAARAASASAPVTAPMPPTGTSQSPVHWPMTW